MSPTAAEPKTVLRQLTQADRAELASFPLSSLEEDSPNPAAVSNEPLSAVLERRLREILDGQVTGLDAFENVAGSPGGAHNENCRHPS